MEEILASIRRIISDDESSTAQPSAASANQQGDESIEAPEAEADERLVSDIARVLSDTAPAVEDEEDILDLTAELGGPESVEEVELVETLEVAESVPPEPAITPPPVAAEAPPPEPEAPAAVSQPPLSASEEAASALDRAIAALRAGQVPTSVAEFMPSPEPDASMSPEPEAALEPEETAELEAAPEPVTETAPEPELETTPEPELETTPEPEPEPETEAEAIFADEPDVTSEFAAEVFVEETLTVEALPAEGEEEAEEEDPGAREETPFWPASPAPLVEREHQTARGNGGKHGASPLESSNKTLEDSVKDLLRPMLKQWLDENMPRVLTAALKDELGDTGPRRQKD